MLFLRLLSLVVRFHAVWPSYPIPVVARAAAAAIRVETRDVDAELLLAIAEHESNLEPDAVSFVAYDPVLRRSRRFDVLLHDRRVRQIPRMVVCGYLSAMATRDECVLDVAVDGAMGRGAEELAEWVATCARSGERDGSCALRGHAGGTACARSETDCSDDQRAFARIFMARARALRSAVVQPRTRTGT